MTKEQLIKALTSVIVEFRNETGFEVTGVDVKYFSNDSGFPMNKSIGTRQILDIEVHVE